MSIRYRVLIFVGVALVLLTGALFLVTNAFIRATCDRLENATLERTLQRMQAGIVKLQDELGRSSQDWAHWTDTYLFALGENDRFVESNLKDEDIATINRQIILIYNRDHQLLFGTLFDAESGEKRPLPGTIAGDLPADHALFTLLPETEAAGGYVKVGEKLYLMQACRILTSDREGPAAGILVFGLEVDSTVSAFVAEINQYAVDAYVREPDDVAHPWRHPARPHETFGSQAHMVGDITFVHAELKAPDGAVVAVLCSAMPRDIFVELSNTQRVMSAAILVTVLVMGLGTIVLLERNVLQPLGNLIRAVLSWGKQDQLSLRLPVEGKGEVKDLGAALNQMLASLDESQRKRQEAIHALSAEKENLRISLASIADAVITTDAGGNVQMINPSAQRMTGWSQEEAEGRALSIVMPLLDERTGNPVDDLTGPVARSGETMTRDRDVLLAPVHGQIMPVSESCAPIFNAAGQLAGFVVVLRNMTKIRRAAEEEQLEEKLGAVGVLAGGIAHDFNNLLTAVLHSISLARNEKTTEARSDAYLKSAEQSILRARGLTTQLLTFASGGDPVRGSVDVAGLIKQSVDLVVRDGGHTVHYDIPRDLSAIHADESQMQQVFTNILLNAIEAMPDGGDLYIRCTHAYADDEDLPATLEKGAYVRIAIEDTGVGIPPELQGRVFEPYFTTKQRGHGLGLASAHSIVGKHGGGIRMSSSAGQGTTVTLYLPASMEEPAAESAPQKTSGATGGRVLFMDDEEMLLTLSVDILTSAGYQVAVAPDGQRAVELYEENHRAGEPFDCVILDLVVRGGMGGLAALREIKKIDPAATVIVSSGYSNDPVMANYREHGFSAVLPKPYSSSSLTSMVEEVLTSNQMN